MGTAELLGMYLSLVSPRKRVSFCTKWKYRYPRAAR